MNYDDTGARLAYIKIFDFYGSIVGKCLFLFTQAVFWVPQKVKFHLETIYFKNNFVAL